MINQLDPLLSELNSWLEAEVLSIDLICLKVAAYFYRHEYEQKDLEDLIALKPTTAEFESATFFLLREHVPEQKKFKEKFIDDAEKILKELKGKLHG